MSMKSHLAALQQKHSNLETQIREVLAQPAGDNSALSKLKRLKLKLKDEMTQLERQTNH